MCQHRNAVAKILRGKKIRLDECIAEDIEKFNRFFVTVASCCGHGRYPRTIVVRHQLTDKNYLLPGDDPKIHPGVVILRKRRFYVKGRDGFYFIPERIK